MRYPLLVDVLTELTTWTESEQIFGCSIKQMKFNVTQHSATFLGEINIRNSKYGKKTNKYWH